jgi:hypothetical protein
MWPVLDASSSSSSSQLCVCVARAHAHTVCWHIKPHCCPAVLFPPPPPPVLQLLMGASDFCGFMHALAVLAPGVDGK